MDLETIDQKIDKLLFHIWFLANQFNSLLSSSCDEAEECDLSVQEIKAIEFLGRTGPNKMKALADYLKLAVSSTTTLVDNLETKGSVVRERSLEDRRVIMLQLTEDGKRNYQTTLDSYRQFCGMIMNALTEKEQVNLLEIFDKIFKVYAK